MNDLQEAQKALKDIVSVLTAISPDALESHQIWRGIGHALGTAKMGLILSGDGILDVDGPNEAL